MEFKKVQYKKINQMQLEKIVIKTKKDIKDITAKIDKTGLSFSYFNDNEEITKRIKKRFEGLYLINNFSYNYNLPNAVYVINALIDNEKKNLKRDLNYCMEFLPDNQVKIINSNYTWNISFMFKWDFLNYSELGNTSRDNVVKQWVNGKYIIQLNQEQYTALKGLI